MASLRPSPVIVLTPVLGEAAKTLWPSWRRIATVFEPIRPVPPITTIFIFSVLALMGRPRRLNLWEEADHEEQVHQPQCKPDRCDEETHHVHANETSRYDRVGSWLLGDAAQLGALDPAL